MDFFDLMIVIVGLGTAAFIAFVFVYVIGTGLVSAWHGLAHHREHAGDTPRTTCGIGSN